MVLFCTDLKLNAIVLALLVLERLHLIFNAVFNFDKVPLFSICHFHYRSDRGSLRRVCVPLCTELKLYARVLALLVFE